MNRVLKFIHNLWTEAQLKAPPSMQRTLIPRLYEAKEIACLLVRPYASVYQLHGQGQGGPLTMSYIGSQFVKTILKNNLFVEEPVEQLVGRIPFWRYGQLADLSSSDIVVIQAAKHLIHRLSRENAIVWPGTVDHTVDVQGDWQELRKRFRKSVRRNELRLVRKYGYEYDLSRDSRDLEDFYYRMYLPTVNERHGEQASPISIDEAYLYFRLGWLFRVKRDDDWVSGVVCYPVQDVVIAKISGVKDANSRLIQEGATAAIYYAAVHWANQHGYEAVNFLGSTARLGSGLFQHKRKWGTTVSIPSHSCRLVWIKVQRFTPAVSWFLKEKHLIVVDRDGRLHGLIVVDDPHAVPAETRKEWEKCYATPGLGSLLIRSVTSFAVEPASVSDPDWVIPTPPSSISGSGY